jgi:hypothetical protein
LALPFILVRLRITDCTIELDADVGFCGLEEEANAISKPQLTMAIRLVNSIASAFPHSLLRRASITEPLGAVFSHNNIEAGLR